MVIGVCCLFEGCLRLFCFTSPSASPPLDGSPLEVVRLFRSLLDATLRGVSWLYRLLILMLPLRDKVVELTSVLL